MSAKVISITERRDRLEEDIRSQLVTTGHALARFEDVDDVAGWRRSARKVARDLGRPVRTLVHDGGVAAALQDWPSGPTEEAAHEAQMRRAMEAVSAALQIGPFLKPVK